ncbi:MAG TPA: methyltransferase domain-containing protein [Tepidisphaeraceae bacterium]|nr:methyltransferase domain-containing protein [Tepidisphaeraceae bacterium]
MMAHDLTTSEAALDRAAREVEHGKFLASGDPELTWGWGTPAGKLRAARRGEVIAEGAGLRPGMRVLEIGCGSGLFTAMFAKTGARIIAVDISPDLLERARARGLPEDQVTFMAKAFEDCDVDGPFDAIIGSSILHHLDFSPALRRIYDLLRPGGVISFAEPNMLNPQVMAMKKVPWVRERLGESPDETAFIRWRLRRVLLNRGFVDIHLKPFDWLHMSTPPPLIPTVRTAGRLLEHIPLAREFSGSLHIVARRPQTSEETTKSLAPTREHPRTPKLKLLPNEQYTGVNRNDPIRFYSYPVFGRMYRQRVELSLAELTGGKRILEVGYGTGLTFLNLRDLYEEIHGLDLTAEVESITRLWERHNVKTQLRAGSVLDMPYADDTFDSVLLISILEHLKPQEQARAMSEIRRVLRPGGQMVYGVPVERPFMAFMFRVLGYDIREHHFSTEKDVEAAAAEQMQRVRVVSMKGRPSVVGPVYEVGHFVKR